VVCFAFFTARFSLTVLLGFFATVLWGDLSPMAASSPKDLLNRP
jgi:hypothetical protein